MTYKFKCEKCGKESELECSMKDYDELKEQCYCECGGKCKRVFEAFEGGIHFQGPGFFNTDNNRNVSWS